MKKLAIFMTLTLALSTVALANPVFEDRGAEASNALYQGKAAEGDDRPVRKKPGRTTYADITLQTWNDPDSDGDGVLTLEDTETLSSNQGQIVSAVKSERPKFKAGAELSKTVNSMYVGDLDGDGLADIAVSIERNGNTVEVAGTSISKRDARKGFYRTETLMNKAELIEAMASEAGLSKADSKKALETYIDVTGEIILGEDRDM